MSQCAGCLPGAHLPNCPGREWRIEVERLRELLREARAMIPHADEPSNRRADWCARADTEARFDEAAAVSEADKLRDVMAEPLWNQLEARIAPGLRAEVGRLRDERDSWKLRAENLRARLEACEERKQ